LAKFVYAFDTAAAMLEIAAKRLKAMSLENWHTEVADHRSLPIGDHEVDLVVSGWSFCYLATLNPATWQAELEKGLAEIERIIKPGGTIIIIETNGTGFEEPHPPEHLAPYFTWLQEKHFERSWIRTDYSFPPHSDAVEVVRSFFGDEMASKIREDRQSILPECTVIWWKRAKNNIVQTL
jgi:ubiquinone/menaquinone biosynthesis C-methylase UbiE